LAYEANTIDRKRSYMKLVKCTKCGSNELLEEKGYVVCAYCRIRYIPDVGDTPTADTVISVYDDIQKLLEKCRSEPENRRRFVRLILDLDPTNTEALQYLK
jgi:hypothetical protein